MFIYRSKQKSNFFSLLLLNKEMMGHYPNLMLTVSIGQALYLNNIRRHL